MSLKEVKEALDALAEHGAESCQRNDGCWACEERALLERARKAIAVIEKAAGALGVAGWLAVIAEDRNITKTERNAVSVFATIAKEAK